MSKLYISSSAQFSELEVLELKTNIPSREIIILDLRMEPHAFVNGKAVCWRTEKNWANLGKSLYEITHDELSKIEALKREAPENSVILTEESLVKQFGFDYIRMAVPDHMRPDDATVESFVTLVESLSPDSWLHVHCAGGSGRSTLMMILYDMLKNADSVSFRDILERQYLIGGKNLLSAPNEEDWRFPLYQERMRLLENFYLYAQQKLRHNISLSWHEWVIRTNH